MERGTAQGGRMKYTLPRDLPPPTVDRDFSHAKPAESSYLHVIGGVIALSSCVTWPLFIFGLEAIAK